MDNEELKAQHGKKMYFIFTQGMQQMIANLKASLELMKTHSRRRVDNLFLRYDEDFFTIERYCRENTAHLINIKKIFHPLEIYPSLVGEFPESRTFAYVSSNETKESVCELEKSLKGRNVDVETIIISS